ncbi:putative ABC transporter [Venturia nashicola]|nr:putative ABC transporter [Venturia nashicola]
MNLTPPKDYQILTIPIMETTPTALYLLDYAYPLSIVAAFTIITAINVCISHHAQTTIEPAKTPRGRVLALCLSLTLVFSYILHAVLYLVHALLERGYFPEQHLILNILSCILVWGGIFVLLLGAASPAWITFAGVWSLGLLFEIVMAALFFTIRSPASSPYELARTNLQGVRIACLLILVLHSLVILRSKEQTGSDEERLPLMQEDANGSASKAVTTYGATSIVATDGAVDEEEQEEEDDKEIKEQQRKRVEEQGWIGYLKGFTVFIPYVWPSGNWKIQFCLALCFLDMISDRFLNVLTPRQVGIIVDKLTTGQARGIMPWKEVLLWIFFKWFGSSSGFGLVQGIALAKVQQYSYARMKTLAFEHVMGLSMDFHSSKDSGEVLKSVEQAESLNDLLELVCFRIGPVFLDMFIALGYITHLFDAYIAFVVVVVGVIYTWMGISLTQRIRERRRLYVEKSRHENRTLYESVANWQSVSYFNRVPYEQVKYKGTVASAFSAQMSYLYTFSVGYAAQSLVMTVGLLAASFLAIYQITSGQKPVGNFVTMVMYWGVMMQPLSSLASSWRRISSTLVDAERLLQLIQSKPSVENHPGARTLDVSAGRVEFKDVDFSYDSRKQTISGLNFVAEPGQTIAFVGETGGGKSTTLKLLFRFYDVTSGSICIDGQDIRDVTLDSLREVIGIVPQDPALFNQTIMENVRYARLDAKNDEVIEACKAAAVHDQIMTFPDGYNSKVGERGVKLSGGELQRIAIARIFLKNPRIVVLDEATSAVDSSIESQIQAAFKTLSKGRTTFVVAHRLSTIMEADMIIVIDQGKILEKGTHDQLLHNHAGKYSELWRKQTTGKGFQSSKASSVTAHLEEEDLILLDHESSLLDQVDGACESKPFQSKQDAGCFGKKQKPRQGGEEDNSSGSFSEGSDTDGPIRMISAKPTFATQTIEPVETKTTPVIAIPISPSNHVTLTFEPPTPTPALSPTTPSLHLTPGGTNRIFQRRGSGFPFTVPDDDTEPEDSNSPDTFTSMRAVRRPTDPSTLHSFDSAKTTHIHTPPSSNVTVPSSITGSSKSARAVPKNPSIPPIPDEAEPTTDDGAVEKDESEEDSDSVDDESPGGDVEVGVQRFTTALEE